MLYYIIVYHIILYYIILYYIYIYEYELRFYDSVFPSNRFWNSFEVLLYCYPWRSSTTIITAPVNLHPPKNIKQLRIIHIYIYTIIYIHIHINDHDIYSSQIYILINDQFIHWHKTYEVLIRLNAEDGVAEAAGG